MMLIYIREMKKIFNAQQQPLPNAPVAQFGYLMPNALAKAKKSVGLLSRRSGVRIPPGAFIPVHIILHSVSH